MDETVMSDLLRQLQGGANDQIAQQLGVAPDEAQKGIQAALPLLLSALADNTRQPQGAAKLLDALKTDHSGPGALGLSNLLGSVGAGGLGSLLGSVLGGAAGGTQMNAAGILGHILGGSRNQAEKSLSQATGMQQNQAGKLLMILAPLVMAALAKRSSATRLDADGLSNMLGQEKQQAQQSGGLIPDLLNTVLGQASSGPAGGLSGLIKMGSQLLGGKKP